MKVWKISLRVVSFGLNIPLLTPCSFTGYKTWVTHQSTKWQKDKAWKTGWTKVKHHMFLHVSNTYNNNHGTFCRNDKQTQWCFPRRCSPEVGCSWPCRRSSWPPHCWPGLQVVEAIQARSPLVPLRHGLKAEPENTRVSACKTSYFLDKPVFHGDQELEYPFTFHFFYLCLAFSFSFYYKQKFWTLPKHLMDQVHDWISLSICPSYLHVGLHEKAVKFSGFIGWTQQSSQICQNLNHATGRVRTSYLFISSRFCEKARSLR